MTSSPSSDGQVAAEDSEIDDASICRVPGCSGHGPIVRLVMPMVGIGIMVHEDGFLHTWNSRSRLARRKPVSWKPASDGSVVPVDRGSRRGQQIAEFGPALTQIGPFRPDVRGNADLPGNFRGVVERDAPGPKGSYSADTVKLLVNIVRLTGDGATQAIERVARVLHLSPDTVKNLYYRGPGESGPQRRLKLKSLIQHVGAKRAGPHEFEAEIKALAADQAGQRHSTGIHRSRPV